MNEQIFEIENGEGEKLALHMCGDLQNTLIISCHGMLADKSSPKHVYLTEQLAKQGLTALRFDFSGRGNSEGKLYDLSLSKQINDLDAVINYFYKQGVEKFGCFGSSFGGTVSILSAARDERITALATLAASAHPEWVEERHPELSYSFKDYNYAEIPEGKLGPTFYNDLFEYNVVRSLSILRIPTYILHGERDEVVPVADALDLASVAQDTRLEVIPEADHRLSNPVQNREAMNGVCQFFRDVFSDERKEP